MEENGLLAQKFPKRLNLVYLSALRGCVTNLTCFKPSVFSSNNWLKELRPETQMSFTLAHELAC